MDMDDFLIIKNKFKKRIIKTKKPKRNVIFGNMFKNA